MPKIIVIIFLSISHVLTERCFEQLQGTQGAAEVLRVAGRPQEAPGNLDCLSSPAEAASCSIR